MSEGLPPQRRLGLGRPRRSGRTRRALEPEPARAPKRRSAAPAALLPRRPEGRRHVRLRRLPVPDPQPRGAPTCPQCGEIVWAYLEDGPRPVPEGEEPGAARGRAGDAAGQVQEGRLDAPVSVQENVKLEP